MYELMFIFIKLFIINILYLIFFSKVFFYNSIIQIIRNYKFTKLGKTFIKYYIFLKSNIYQNLYLI